MIPKKRYTYEVIKDFVDELEIFNYIHPYHYKKGDLIRLRKGSKLEKKWSELNYIKIVSKIEPTY